LLKKLSRIFLKKGLDRLLGDLSVGQAQYLAVVIPGAVPGMASEEQLHITA
jgi:hypothetical protein